MKRYVCALIALVITFSGSAYAAEEIMATTENSVVADDNQKVSLTGEELIIISPFIADPREYEIYLPEAQYIYENREYDLESYEVIEAVIEEHTKCTGSSWLFIISGCPVYGTQGSGSSRSKDVRP